MQPQGNHQERNDDVENNIEEDSMGVLKSLYVDDLYESVRIFLLYRTIYLIASNFRDLHRY